MRDRKRENDKFNMRIKMDWKPVKYRTWSQNKRKTCSEETMSVKNRCSQSWGKSIYVRKYFWKGRFWVWNGTVRELWIEEETDTGKEESNVDRLARGCQREHGSWFQIWGEAYLMKQITNQHGDYNTQWGRFACLSATSDVEVVTSLAVQYLQVLSIPVEVRSVQQVRTQVDQMAAMHTASSLLQPTNTLQQHTTKGQSNLTKGRIITAKPDCKQFSPGFLGFVDCPTAHTGATAHTGSK